MDFVIIGDGIAGATAAETLRERDGDANITVLTDESEPLYSRIMLKNYMKGTLPKHYTRVHDRNWYESRGIDLELETRVVNVDTDRGEVETRDGDSYSYDRLLVASGGSPRQLPQDDDLENIKYMWTMDDAEHIKKDAEEVEKAVVVGGGLLGIDLAVVYAEHDVETHYLIREDNWWSRGLDGEGAEIIHRKLEEEGVEIVTGAQVEDLETGEGRVTAVNTDSGERFECDTLAVAIGQTPNSDFVDVEKNGDGAIKTDEYLQTSEKDVYAAGNRVEYRSPVFEKRIEIGSWDHSEAMGETAAKNMLGEETEFDFVNTYGMGHFDVQFLAIGEQEGETVSRELPGDGYRRLFLEDGNLRGAVLIGETSGQEKLKEWISEGREFQEPEKAVEESL